LHVTLPPVGAFLAFLPSAGAAAEDDDDDEGASSNWTRTPRSSRSLLMADPAEPTRWPT